MINVTDDGIGKICVAFTICILYKNYNYVVKRFKIIK